MSKLKIKIKETRINDKGAEALIQNARIAFVNIAKPNTTFSNKNEAGEPIDGKYGVTVLIPKKESEKFQANLTKIIKQLIQLNTGLKSKSDKQKAERTALKYNQDGSLVKDGDKAKDKDGNIYDGLAGHNTLKASTKAIKKNGGFVPMVSMKTIYINKQAIPKDRLSDELYSGVWADVGVRFVPYSTGKNIGVTCYLMGVMKLQDDERLGSSDPFEVRDDIDAEVPDFSTEEF